jgi:hypothetical protein
VTMPVDPRIALSSRAMFAMAEHFHQKGAKVTDVKQMLPPSKPERAAHLERGNIMLINDRKVSVRAIDAVFAGAGDWPWGQQCFVESRAEFERNPCGLYVSVSKDLRHAAVVKAGTRTKWFPVQRLAHADAQMEWFLVCPVEHVEFVQLLSKEASGG